MEMVHFDPMDGETMILEFGGDDATCDTMLQDFESRECCSCGLVVFFCKRWVLDLWTCSGRLPTGVFSHDDVVFIYLLFPSNLKLSKLKQHEMIRNRTTSLPRRNDQSHENFLQYPLSSAVEPVPIVLNPMSPSPQIHHHTQPRD